jgi:hypothetical protein
MLEQTIAYQRKLIEVETRLGFIYVPAQVRELLPNKTGKVHVQLFDETEPSVKNYNADHYRIFGLTSFYKRNGLKPSDIVSVTVSPELISVAIVTAPVIEIQEPTEDESFIDISGLSSQAKGNVAEDRVKEIILLNSQGLLNVYRPVIDTHGIDLIVLKEGVFLPIYLQVKSRFQVVKSDQLILSIGKNTFRQHHAFYLVGIAFDPDKAEIGEHILFIPSGKVIEMSTIVKTNGREYYRINVTYSRALESKYKKYFVTKRRFVESLLDKFEAMSEIIK